MRRADRTGFSLLELAAVMTVVMLLVTVLLPAVRQVQAVADRVVCTNNLRQCSLATLNFEAAHGRLPAGAEFKAYAADPWLPPAAWRHSHWSKVLPFLDESAVFDRVNFTLPLIGQDGRLRPEHATVAAVRLGVLLCPADPESGRVVDSQAACSYAGNAGTAEGGNPFDGDGLLFIDSKVRYAHIRDGTSHTALFSELAVGRPYDQTLLTPLPLRGCPLPQTHTRPRLGGSWLDGTMRTTLYGHAVSPIGGDCIGLRVGGGQRQLSVWGRRQRSSHHAGGGNVAQADGSVQFLSSNLRVDLWEMLGSRAGGEFERVGR